MKKLLQAYTDAIDAKGKDVALKIDLRKVMHAGNEDFLKVYNAMWAMIQKSEADGCSAYQKELGRIELPSSKESSKQREQQQTRKGLTACNFWLEKSAEGWRPVFWGFA